MRIGAMCFVTDTSMTPDELAVELEERGYESMWVTEHTHIPSSRRTPWPSGGPLPDYYRRILDPFVALTAAAGVTSTLRLATGITLVAQRDPIILAKSVASLDLVSGGRLILGVGFGWNVEEMRHHGVHPATRRDRAREHVLAMCELWSRDEASFDGQFVSFSPTWSWPKPVQRPHPPIVVAGAGSATTFRQIVEYADGWMPLHGRGDIIGRVPRLREAAEAAGREAGSIEVTVAGSSARPEVLDAYAEAGVARCTLFVPPGPRHEVLPVLERYQRVVEAWA